METLELIRDLNNLLGDPARIGRTLTELSVGIAVIVFLFNTIQCFFGYKLTKLWISISGFFLFGLIGLGIGAASGGSDTAIVWALILGVIGAIIAFTLYKIGIFILGFIGGTIIGILVFNTISIGVVLGVIMGILSVILTKPVIIISTAVPAGMLAGNSLVTIFGSNSKVLGIVLGIIYAIAGIAVQWITNKDVKAKAPLAGTTSNTTANKEGTQNYSDRTEGYIETPIVETMSEMAKQAQNNINHNISNVKQKVQAESAKASEESKGLNIFEVLTELKSIFYSGKISKYIMLYCEVIIYYLLAQEVIATYISSHRYLSWDISKAGILLAIPLCILAISKKEYYSSIAYFSVAGITSIIKLLHFSRYYLNMEQLVYLLVIVGIDILIIKLFLKTEKGIELKKRISKLFSNNSYATTTADKIVETKIMVRCHKCGALCSETASFCQSCGEKIIMASNEDKEENELNEEMLELSKKIISSTEKGASISE